MELKYSQNINLLKFGCLQKPQKPLCFSLWPTAFIAALLVCA